jgi:hypothetical protein
MSTSTAASIHSVIALENWPYNCITFMTRTDIWKLKYEVVNQPAH